MDSEARVLIEFADSVFYGPGWHGAELYPTLQSLTLEQALQPAGPDGYCAWQLMLHCAYWKHVILQRLGVLTAGFERAPDDFPALPDPADGEAWERDLQLLVDKHEAIKAEVRRLGNDELSQMSTDDRFSKESLVLSLPAHDASHTAHIRNMGVEGLK
jgi:hypothetical protein